MGVVGGGGKGARDGELRLECKMKFKKKINFLKKKLCLG